MLRRNAVSRRLGRVQAQGVAPWHPKSFFETPGTPPWRSCDKLYKTLIEEACCISLSHWLPKKAECETQYSDPPLFICGGSLLQRR